MDEFLAADVYVIGVPMYNLSIPSMLKAYIDQIVRIGRTFAFAPEDAANPCEGGINLVLPICSSAAYSIFLLTLSIAGSTVLQFRQ